MRHAVSGMNNVSEAGYGRAIILFMDRGALHLSLERATALVASANRPVSDTAHQHPPNCPELMHNGGEGQAIAWLARGQHRD